MRKVKIYHVRQIILTKDFLRIICNKRWYEGDMNSNLRQIGFLTPNVRLYIKFILQYFRGLCFLDRLCLSFAPMVRELV